MMREEVGRHKYKATNKIAGDEGEKVGRHKPTNERCSSEHQSRVNRS
jgi:hypothetical protein